MNTPFVKLTLYYVLIVSLFASLLFAPFSHTGTLSFLDSFFLSCSAISGTGLSPILVSDDLTRVGQLILLIEIQLGGIGIMVLVTYLLLLFGKKISVPNMVLTSFDQNQNTLVSIKKITLYVLSISLLIETFASILFFVLLHGRYESFSTTLFFSIFHSVSSFTNSGMDLFGDSLFSFAKEPLFLLLTSCLIIGGAIGYPMYIELLNTKRLRYSLYFKVNVFVHASLLISGTIIFCLIEWKNTVFQSFGIVETLTNMFLLAVSPRNAGFAAFDLNGLSEASLLFMMFLMFIGSSSSSSGGGIRTTTFAVIVSKCLSIIKGKTPSLFKRSVSKEDVERSFLIFFLFSALFFLSTLLLMVVEEKSFMSVGFEVMSALSTTGLSLGITADLSAFSKLWLSGLMLIGRIGFITFLYVWVKPDGSKTKYTEEDLVVG